MEINMENIPVVVARRPERYPPLTANHRRQRLNWARKYVVWNIEDWARCLFTDKSKFVLFRQDGRLRVWIRPGERYSENCMTSRTSFGGSSILIWGGTCLGDSTELITYRNVSVTT
ncbi:hypothetical protein ILUMI_15141 [Ignelater luminosus]|uniref:Transposase n=1 Tax=Ignelater luminosus TaxID=2038154 RepID=A0A8K0CTI6_IGNLU|nr:hypothetical protein ILUMI_15141 [Ignelater luminosus]